MTNPTHREFAITWAAIAAIGVYVAGISELHFYLALIIMIQTGKAGALFPDLDHYWKNVKNKNVLTWVINKVIHLTGGKHRSWQTHSIDIAIVLTIVAMVLPGQLYAKGLISVFNMEVLKVMCIGFMVGWDSHVFSDMLTPGGVRLFCFKDYKISIVPRRFLGISFVTGSGWEELVYRVSKINNVVLIAICLIFPLIIKYIT